MGLDRRGSDRTVLSRLNEFRVKWDLGQVELVVLNEGNRWYNRAGSRKDLGKDMRLGKFETNRLYCGDSAELLKGLPEGCIDLTVTSPPYGNLRAYNGFTFDFETIAKELYRVTKEGGVVAWVVGDETIDGSESCESFRQALYFRGLGFNLHDTMIYNKGGFRYPFPNRYHQVFEYMFVFSRGKVKTFNPLSDRVNTPEKRMGVIETRKEW